MAQVTERVDSVERPADRRAVALVTLGHVFNDVNQGAVPALLPFLVIERGLTFAEAGGLMLAANILSSVTQPLFGLLADSRSATWVMPAGILTAGSGIALAGVAPTYPWLVAAILLSGLGVAAFHPEGSRCANHAAGSRKSTGMSFFAVGGNVGFASGPVIITPLLVIFGVAGAVWMIVPAGAMALVLLANLRRLASPPSLKRTRGEPVAQEDRQEVGAFVRLTGVVILRSVAFFSFVAFIPLYWLEVLGATPALSNASLTILLGAGVVGTLGGGWLADRWRARPIVIGGLIGVGALLSVLLATGAAGAPALLLLVVMGVCLYLPFAVMITMGHAYLWRRIGTASGVTIGLSMTIGGLVAPLLGAYADRNGLPAALWIVAVVPLVGAALASTLPPPRHRT